MRQRKKHQTRGPQFDYFDRREIGVAGILAQLVDLIGATETLQNQCPSTWKAKRRRSVPGGNGEDQFPSTLPDDIDQMPAATVSPATPLSFSPTESEEKTKRSSRKTSKKTTKRKEEEVLQTVTELTKQKESLLEDLASTKRSLVQLRADNTELIARKPELCLRFEKVQPSLETYSSALLGYGQVHRQSSDHSPWRSDLLERNGQCQSGPTGISPPSCSGLVGGVVEVGPRRIPDLNAPPEDAGDVHPFQPLDFMSGGASCSQELNRAMAARAWWRRMRVYQATRKLIGAPQPQLRHGST